MKILCLIIFLSMFPIASSPLYSQEVDNQNLDKKKNTAPDKIEQLKRELKEYQLMMVELKARIAKLEIEKQKLDLQKLLEEAEEATRTETETSAEFETKVFTGHQRQQQSLNPNISVTGDFIGALSNIDETHHHGENHHEHEDLHGKKFMLREAEFHIVSNLDPFTRAKFFLGIPGNGSLHIGEAYMEWLNLPFNINLKIGKYRSQFGFLNRWHDHGLPQVDRPKALTHFLGDHGLGGIGAGCNILLPNLFTHANELDVEVIYGGDGVSFTNKGTRQWVGVSHLKNYWDLTSNAYLELGFSGAYGKHDSEQSLKTVLGGIDLTYKWVPADRSKYRTFEFRNELIYSRHEGLVEDSNSFGFYSYIDNKLSASWWAGLRFDYTQEPESHDDWLWGVSPYLTFWQSEFVFIRFQFSHFNSSHVKDENVILFQSVWSIGPHKHEAY